jgi:hypothetical protein
MGRARNFEFSPSESTTSQIHHRSFRSHVAQRARPCTCSTVDFSSFGGQREQLIVALLILAWATCRPVLPRAGRVVAHLLSLPRTSPLTPPSVPPPFSQRGRSCCCQCNVGAGGADGGCRVAWCVRAGRVTRNYTEAYVARRALFREDTKRRMTHIAARKAKASPLPTSRHSLASTNRAKRAVCVCGNSWRLINGQSLKSARSSRPGAIPLDGAGCATSVLQHTHHAVAVAGSGGRGGGCLPPLTFSLSPPLTCAPRVVSV